jgi:hypothetical protein
LQAFHSVRNSAALEDNSSMDLLMDSGMNARGVAIRAVQQRVGALITTVFEVRMSEMWYSRVRARSGLTGNGSRFKSQ